MQYQLVNNPSIIIELNADGTASLIKRFSDGTAYRLTRISYWNEDHGQRGHHLSDEPFAYKDATQAIFKLVATGGCSFTYPVREMMPDVPKLGVRVFARSNEAMLQLKLGNNPAWIDVYNPNQVLISCKMEPVSKS